MTFRHLPFPARAAGRLTACLVLILSISGCTHLYQVRVEALRTPEQAPRRSYHLVSASAEREAVDPSYPEAAAVAHRALEANGLYQASRPEWADMVVALDFGVGPRRLVSVPNNSARDAGATSIYYPDKDSGSVGHSSGVAVPASALKKVVVVREKKLSLVARENPIGTQVGPARAGAELWRVEVAIEDATPSIDELLPVLAAAMVDYIDEETPTTCVRHLSARAPERMLVSQASY